MAGATGIALGKLIQVSETVENWLQFWKQWKQSESIQLMLK